MSLLFQMLDDLDGKTFCPEAKQQKNIVIELV